MSLDTVMEMSSHQVLGQTNWVEYEYGPQILVLIKPDNPLSILGCDMLRI